jgi:hypothetical protein
VCKCATAVLWVVAARKNFPDCAVWSLGNVSADFRIQFESIRNIFQPIDSVISGCSCGAGVEFEGCDGRQLDFAEVCFIAAQRSPMFRSTAEAMSHAALDKFVGVLLGKLAREIIWTCGKTHFGESRFYTQFCALFRKHEAAGVNAATDVLKLFRRFRMVPKRLEKEPVVDADAFFPTSQAGESFFSPLARRRNSRRKCIPCNDIRNGYVSAIKKGYVSNLNAPNLEDNKACVHDVVHLSALYRELNSRDYDVARRRAALHQLRIDAAIREAEDQQHLEPEGDAQNETNQHQAWLNKRWP